MSDDKKMTVEVVYGLPHKQALIELQVSEGTTVLEAAQQHGEALQFASVPLRDDREVVLAAVRQHGLPALQYASEKLRCDREMKLESEQRGLEYLFG